jgi:hypothetical protein
MDIRSFSITFLFGLSVACSSSGVAVPADDAAFDPGEEPEPPRSTEDAQPGDARPGDARPDDDASSDTPTPDDAQPTGCVPGTTEDRACGRCGVQTRVCGPSGTFGPFGGCASEGVCTPGAKEVSASALTCKPKEAAARTCTSKCTWGEYACACDESKSLCGATVLVLDAEGLGQARKAVETFGGVAEVVTNNIDLTAKLGAAKKPRVLILEVGDYTLDAGSLRAIRTWVTGGGRTIYRGFLPTDELKSIFAATVGPEVRAETSFCGSDSSIPFGPITRTGSGPDFFRDPAVTNLRLGWWLGDCRSGNRWRITRSAPVSPAAGEIVGASTRRDASWPVIAVTHAGKVIVHTWQIGVSDPEFTRSAYTNLLINELAFLGRP